MHRTNLSQTFLVHFLVHQSLLKDLLLFRLQDLVQVSAYPLPVKH
ncbi:hypothetical protein EVA_18033 [gut metagenome]|uniref:Uncharacterized protein n=1 Tax=gut metagenome TaxID=749906 RepID=J9C205_9ZZZZ